MKKISYVLVTLIIAITLLASSCSRDSTDDPGPAPGPDVIALTEGFLSTKTGYNIGDFGDTAIVLCYSSSYALTDTYLGGAVSDKDHYWHLENAGGDARYIRSTKQGLYLGYKTYASAPSGCYDWALNWITLDKTPGDNNRFYIIKKDKNFYIQSATDQTLYLNTTSSSQISYTGPKVPVSLFFLPEKQAFFFLKPF
jgi:hypothetical protein